MLDINELFKEKTLTTSNKLEHGISLHNDLEIWIESFNRELVNLNRSENTLDSYRFTLSALKSYCLIYMPDKKGLCKISVDSCNDFLLWMENYETNKKYGSLKERISYLVEFLTFCSKENGDFIELSQKYLSLQTHELDKISYALSEFEDYYYENEIPIKEIANHYIVNYIETLPTASIATMTNRRAVMHKFFMYIAKETQTECFKEIFRKLKVYKKSTGAIQAADKFIGEETMCLLLDLMDRYIQTPTIVHQKTRSNSQRVAYRDTAMVLLMYRGGLRVSEALNTRLSDIVDNGETYRVNILNGKGNKSRTTYFKKCYFEKHYLYFKNTLSKAESFLSENANNNKLNRRTLYANVGRIFQVLVLEQKKLGNSDIGKLSGLHIFRHQFGSEFAEKDGNMKILQDLLGHSSIITTMIYSKTGERAKEEALK